MRAWWIQLIGYLFISSTPLLSIMVTNSLAVFAASLVLCAAASYLLGKSTSRFSRSERRRLLQEIRTAEQQADKPQPRAERPHLGERILLLLLRTEEERNNIPGDLEEEYWGIATKHGARYAKLWYYKQVVASAWPMLRKAVKWRLLASLGV